MRNSPTIRAPRSPQTSLAHGPLREVHLTHGRGGVVLGTRPANSTRGMRRCHPRDSSREFHSRHAARRPLYTCSHGAMRFPNSHYNCLHFSRPRPGLVPSAERFGAGFRSHDRASLGHSQNTERTSHAASRGAGAVSKITRSVARPTTPVWVGPCPISSRALIHSMLFARCLPSGTHSGTIILGACVSPKDPGVSIPPKLGMCSFAPCNRSTSYSLTGPTSSRSASREHIVSPCSCGRLT